jgi:predicted GIY-YIG superfamily endonuclease
MNTRADWSVYTLFNDNQELLYVGISRDVAKRMRQHLRTKTWAAEVDHVVINESALTQHGALGLESALIRQLQPKFNVTHNYRDEPPEPVDVPATSKARFQRWYDEFAMKQWFCFSFTSQTGAEIPVFALGKRNQQVLVWTDNEADESVEVHAGSSGRATVHDKDVLLYLLAQLLNTERAGRPRTESRTFCMDVHNYLTCVYKMSGPGAHAKLVESLRRLSETKVVRQIRQTNGYHRSEFGILYSWAVVDCDAAGVPITMTITVSEWVFDTFRTGRVFRIPYEYFQSRSALLRRVHELAGHRCRDGKSWTIPIGELLTLARGDDRGFSCFPWGAFDSQSLPGLATNVDRINRIVRLRQKL